MTNRPPRLPRDLAEAAGPASPAQALAETPLASRVAYDGGLLHVHRDVVRCPDGHIAYREYIRHPGAVVVIPMLDDEHVILERQFRYPLGRAFIEFPAGKIDPGESLQVCAERELLEETGYRARDWQHLGGFHNAIGYSDERIDIYIARSLQVEQVRRDPGEVMELFQAPWRELAQWVGEGRITDCKTIIGIYWLERALARGHG